MTRDPTEEMYRKHPLMRFSLYTHTQSRAIRNLGDEILSILVSLINEDGTIDATKFTRV
jgi:hypothetical protein